VYAFPDVHVAGVAPSSEHLKVDALSALKLNPIDVVGWVVGAEEVIVVSGAGVATVHSTVAGVGSVAPSCPVATTLNSC
jgi:hypothetical protein